MNINAAEVTPPECTICLEDVWEGCKTPCGHIFHAGCLIQWLETRPAYPTCSNCTALCWPGALDMDFYFVGFIGFLPGGGVNQEHQAVQEVHAIPDGNAMPQEAEEVQWVMDIPAHPNVEGQAQNAEPEVQWVMDIPAGGNEVQWMMDIPAIENGENSDIGGD